MAHRDRWPFAAVLAVAAVLMAVTILLQQARDRRYPLATTDDASMYLTSGPALRRLTLSFQTLAADVYWIRAIQYYGGTKRRLGSEQQAARVRAGGAGTANDVPARGEYALLYPMLDLTTSLDPRFNIAYRFGAIFLAEPYPAGPGRPDLAVALLQKGLRERPDKWEYKQDIGFIYYWWIHDYAAAANWFRMAGEVPGAPWWLKSLAATTLAQGGDRRSSRLMWETIRQSAEIDWLRREAERRLAQLQALDQIDVLQRAVDHFSASGGPKVTDWLPLVGARILPGVPVDPTGVPYELSDGRVRLSPSSSLFPLPTEPAPLHGPAS